MRQTCTVHKIVNKKHQVVNKFGLIGTDVELMIGKFETRVETVGGTLKLKPLSIYESQKKVRIVCKDYVYTFYKCQRGGDYYGR